MFYKSQKKFIFFAKNVFCRFAIPKNTGYIVADCNSFHKECYNSMF